MIGIICLAVFRLNVGIDFTSGSRIEVLADQSLTTEEMESHYEALDLNPAGPIVLSGDNQNIAVAKFDKELSKDKVAEIRSYFEEKYGSSPTINTVSPVVGKELAKNAVLAVLYASVGIIIYITIRFEFYSAVTAILALLHDAFFILTFFSITRLDFDITIIAAILTIVGYSINDTIVTFDRIRENLKKEKACAFIRRTCPHCE